MSSAVSFFIENELDILLVDAPCLLLYLFFAIAMVFLIRFFGPYSISSYKLESDYEKNSAGKNIAYRIIAPVVWCYFLLLIAALILSICKIDFAFHARWLPIAMYWAEMLFLKIATRKFSFSIWAYLLEVIASLAIAIYFDWAVVCQLPESGLLAVDQSNIGFQIAAALFFAVIEVIMTLAIRRNYKVNYVIPYFSNFNQLRYYRALVPTEQRLYEYRRRFGKLLPQRFLDDTLLRTVFYSIMCIEDANRPHSVRILENFLARVGAAKTTGIMQQKADYPLTDEESVELAIPYIEKMWDRYLQKFAKSVEGSFSDPIFTFTSTGYSYDYSALASILSTNFSLLYGDYCGTRSLQASYVFEEVKSFEERENYDFIPGRILANGSVFPEECSLIPNEILYWSNVETVESTASATATLELVNRNNGTQDELLALTSSLRKNGFAILAVSFGPAIFQRIRISKGGIEDLPPLNNNWLVEML